MAAITTKDSEAMLVIVVSVRWLEEVGGGLGGLAWSTGVRKLMTASVTALRIEF